MFKKLHIPLPAVQGGGGLPGGPPPRLLLLLWLASLTAGLLVLAVTVAAGHGDLLSQMEVFKGVKEIKGVTVFLEDIKGYLLSIVLAGFTIAGVGAGAAKFVGHSRANDLIFNIGVGVAIFAAIPTLAA
jgi:hypothetical protein